MKTEEKKPNYYQAKIATLEAEIERLKSGPNWSDIDGNGGQPYRMVVEVGPNPFSTLPTFAKALVLNEWQRIDYISPWLGTQQLSPARVEGADRWSVVRNDQYIVLTHESGYYGRDMGQIGKREAADAMAGLIRYLRRAEDEPPSNPAEWHTVAESKLELAKWEEKLERCNEAISAFKSTVYRFALDLSWGEVVAPL